ncbi:hypothetical protein PRIPAC_95978, partial [Pristionchus pacificus]|uniref:Uncharacterized protein n=1 Tax=Pristionchus pacificus TaxID=54126 RepID=A0A2A6D299_PRIPA
MVDLFLTNWQCYECLICGAAKAHAHMGIDACGVFYSANRSRRMREDRRNGTQLCPNMIIRQVCLIILFVVRCSNSILIGECIGPRQALERHLSKSDKTVMYNIVYGQFHGKNAQEVMRYVLTFVRSRLSEEQWDSLLPEIRSHEMRHPACSTYAQLLPKELYRRLLLQTWDAAEAGAPLATIRSIVNRIVADAVRRGLLSPDAAASLTVPPGTKYDGYVAKLIPKLPEPKPIPPIDQLPWYTSANALLDRRDWMEEDETDPRTTERPERRFKMIPLPPAQPLRGHFVHDSSA